MIELEIRGHHGARHTAMIDDSDGRQTAFTWRLTNNGYAMRQIKLPGAKPRRSAYFLLHREILDLRPGDPNVDHINGDKLDCRRSNLRLCPLGQVQNIQNAAKRKLHKGKPCHSRHKGVSIDVGHNGNPHWRADITVDRKRRFLGWFDDEDDAGRAYNREARKHFGEFARLNSVPPQ